MTSQLNMTGSCEEREDRDMAFSDSRCVEESLGKDVKDLVIMGIETSCDDTAVGIVKGDRTILANFSASQIELHKPHGGIVPILARRAHSENISSVLQV